ncbi:MAG: hypothetical protein ACLUW6_12325, partial [Coriobacteriaceae bacterium]
VTGAKEIIQYLEAQHPAITSLAPARFLPPAGASPAKGREDVFSALCRVPGQRGTRRRPS